MVFENHKRIFIVILLVWALMLLTALQISFVRAFESEKVNQIEKTTLLDQSGIESVNCRYGVATQGMGGHGLSWLPTMGVGWHLNFGANALDVPDVEFVPVIRVKQDTQNGTYLPGYTTYPLLSDNNGDLGPKITSNPGKLWLIGNEPDVANPVQDNTMPKKYAEIYHDVYHFIKDRDPSAQVGIAGLSMATPGRLQYLDIVWNEYIELYGTPMDVDVWNIHLYILSEKKQSDGGNSDGKIALGTDPALAKLDALNLDPNQCPLNMVYCRAEHDSATIFVNQLVSLRTWMKEHGQQNKPLIISEFSILYPFVDYDDENNPTECYLMDELGGCFTPNRINNYMEATMDWMETAVDANIGYPADNNRLVQQWLWFSLNMTDPISSGASSNLLKNSYVTSSAGDPGAFTAVGENFVDEVLSRPVNVNLKAAFAYPIAENIEPPDTTAAVTLTIEYYNNGNTTITQPFDVTFYSNQALTQEIGSVSISPDLLGCARTTYTASVEWDDLSPGKYDYWAVVDSGNDISEEANDDNVVQGIVLINPGTVYLPSVSSSVP